MPDITFNPRLYQETILDSCLKKNTLVVLPTGLGKTKVAILTLAKRLKDYPSTKSLFLTPTKPLANQIFNEIKNSTTEKNISLFTGAVSPKKRKELWKNSKIIVSTPQCIENDLINKNLNLKTVSTLIIDEAHRAVQNYSYTWITKEYHSSSNFERIIGLTASPGSDLKKILEVCKNLYSKEIEIRIESDPDVKQYVQEVKIEKIIIELPESFKKIRKYLQDSLKSKLESIKQQGIISLSSNPSKTEILRSQARIQGEIAKGTKDYGVFRSISLLAEILKISHAIDLLETQGITPVYSYFETIFKESRDKKTKAVKNLVTDLNFKSAYILTKKLKENNIKHPKQEKLKEIIEENIKKDPNIKIIVFNHFRSSVKELEKEINKINSIKAKLFVGQSKKLGIGLRQKEQIAILEKFKNNKYNCLISTSIGEEGLDLPKVDLVIFYEPIPSAIRSIQRRGRTARHDKGKIIILVTKNTRDESNFWSAYHKEKKMYSILDKVRSELKIQKQPTLQNFVKKTNLIIYVDSREGNSGITKILHDLGINLKIKPLVSADFIISERIGIERKTPKDFIDSMIDKRLFTQIRGLKENFEKPLIIIEGTEDIYSIRNIHPNAIRGMLATITLSYGIPIIYTKNKEDTAELLKVISLREQKPNSRDMGVRLEKKPTSTKEQQEFIIESLPGIGPFTAKTLLNKLKSIENILNAPLEILEQIEGIGSKRSKEIKRIFKEIYEN
jgi:Fanconi anemia group M protein